ncbi:protein amnionless-like [Styela clava]
MESKYIFVFWLLVLTVQRCQSESHRHTFTANTNFDNPNRWSDADHGYPCAGDKIEFEADKVISIFVQSDLTISEVILPMNGEFVFDDDVNWGTSEELAPCADNDHTHVVHFISDADDWFKTGNWEAYDGNQNPISRQDLLDIEQVPCLYDDVQFITSNSFTTELSANTQVQGLSVWDRVLDSSGFANYRVVEGKYQFIGSGQLNIDDSGCQDATGCSCLKPDNVQATFSRICSNMDCPTPSCLKPITAVGNCCPSCGSMLTFNYTSPYTEQAMRDFVESFMSKPEYKGCHAAISKVTSDMVAIQQEILEKMLDEFDSVLSVVRLNDQDKIQILVTDEEIGSKSGDIAKKLANEIYSELTSPDNSLGVSSITMQSSGPGQDQNGGLNGGAIAGIVIGTLLGVLVLMGLALYVLRSAPLRGKKFRLSYTLNDKDVNNRDTEMFPSVTEVGPGPEFESTDDNPNNPKAAQLQQDVANIRSVLNSDFGVSFGNPAFEGDDV